MLFYLFFFFNVAHLIWFVLCSSKCSKLCSFPTRFRFWYSICGVFDSFIEFQDSITPLSDTTRFHEMINSLIIYSRDIRPEWSMGYLPTNILTQQRYKNIFMILIPIMRTGKGSIQWSYPISKMKSWLRAWLLVWHTPTVLRKDKTLSKSEWKMTVNNSTK